MLFRPARRQTPLCKCILPYILYLSGIARLRRRRCRVKKSQSPRRRPLTKANTRKRAQRTARQKHGCVSHWRRCPGHLRGRYPLRQMGGHRCRRPPRLRKSVITGTKGSTIVRRTTSACGGQRGVQQWRDVNRGKHESNRCASVLFRSRDHSAVVAQKQPPGKQRTRHHVPRHRAPRHPH